MKLTDREKEIVRATIMLHEANKAHLGFVPDYYLTCASPNNHLQTEELRQVRDVVQDVALQT
jgi:hypothetical protein